MSKINVELNLFQIERIIEYMKRNGLRDIDEAITSMIYMAEKGEQPK